MLVRYEKALMAKTTKTSKTTKAKKAPAEKKVATKKKVAVKPKATEKIKGKKKGEKIAVQAKAPETKKAAEKEAEKKPAEKVKAAPKKVAPKPEVKAKPAEVKAKPKAEIIPPLGHGVGRRKSSVARVWLKRGKGSLIVNGKKFTTYFDIESNRIEAYKPFVILPAAKDYDVEVNVYGGGVNSQAGAVRLGISRALLQANESFRSILRKNGLLTVDDRVKERKKYGQPSARAKFQFVKR